LAHDAAPIFNPKGMPYAFCFRQILEQCATVEEAERLLRATERSTILSLALCDRQHSVVLEITPRSVAVRRPSEGILACTNHFRTEELAVWPMQRLCNRYPKLIQCRSLDQLDVSDVAQKMNEVNMGRMTVQTMIFEPATLKLHLAIGACPSSALPMKLLELGPLFAP
jgi:isopenicillin-N N-acyltransferase like protein